MERYLQNETGKENGVEVSIIVPLYNREEKIARCLDSLLNQTLINIEIIVVDDGSIDGGASVVEKYAEGDNRIRLIRQENQGQGAARNTGIKAAQGEYVGFVDSDDYVEINMYETLLNAVRKNQTEVAICQQKDVCFKDDGEMIYLGETVFPCDKQKVFEKKQLLDWFVNFTYLCLNSVCYKLVKKAVFVENDIWFPEKHRYAEDLPASGGIFSVIESAVLVPESFYFYIHEEETLSTSYSVRKAGDVYQDMLDVMEYLKKAGYEEPIDNFVLGMYFSSMRQFYADKNSENRQTPEGKELLLKWKAAKKNRKPVFKGKDVPFFHKVKVLVTYLHLEALVCRCINLFSSIPFFKFMA